jgi:hypothetical protein
LSNPIGKPQASQQEQTEILTNSHAYQSALRLNCFGAYIAALFFSLPSVAGFSLSLAMRRAADLVAQIATRAQVTSSSVTRRAISTIKNSIACTSWSCMCISKFLQVSKPQILLFARWLFDAYGDVRQDGA